MNRDLENIKIIIEKSEKLSESEKEALLHSIKAVEKELAIIEFKLDRTEKVKRTTSVLLEETIDELEKKREDVVLANEALKKSLEELKAAQAQLIHSEKMASLGELTAGIAHEIQNPLNFVNNFSEVSVDLVDELVDELKKGDPDEVKTIAGDLKKNLEKIVHHGKRASGIVKGMLEHSRAGSGEKTLIDINTLCDEYLRLAYHGMRAKDKSFNVKIETDFDTNLPEINVVSQDIGRVLLNLINNAFYVVSEARRAKETAVSEASAKETAGSQPSGQAGLKLSDSKIPQKAGAEAGSEGYLPEVIVSTKAIILPGDSPAGRQGARGGFKAVQITVKDNGTGIPDEIRDKIFQPFFTTKPTGQGTGLGLSLSYDIVKAHGGELYVESDNGQGTTFTVQLPVNGKNK